MSAPDLVGIPVAETVAPRPVSARRTQATVVVADDHPLFREAVVRAIRERPELLLVGEAADGRSALALIREHEPEVAVLDLRLPGLDGQRVLKALSRDELSTRVLLLSAFLDGSVVYDAMAAGAAGYLSKDADRREILDAIAVIARGGTVLDDRVQDGLAAEIRGRGSVDRAGLTPRELEVLRHIAAGRSAPDIGKLLHLSPATIKGHLQTLYEKLGVSERAAAVAEGMRRGLIE